MTDAEATEAIEVLLRKHRGKLVCQARKFTRPDTWTNVADMIHEALLSGWANRAKIQCMEAYVMGAVHFQAIGWLKRKNNKELQWAPGQRAELYSTTRPDLSVRSDDGFVRRSNDNGDWRGAIQHCKNHKAPIPGIPFWQCLFAHALIHAGFVALITGSVGVGIVEFAVHSLIDFGKCNNWYGFNSDQAMHVACKVAYAAILFGAAA